MAYMKPKTTWKTIILPVIGMLVFLAYLYLFSVDIPIIIETVQRINVSIYLISILLVLAEVLFYTISWQSLLNSLSIKLSTVKAYLYVWYAIYMEIAIPTASISGEISKLYLVTREKSGVGGKVIATLVIQRLMVTGIIIASLIIGVVTLSAERQVSGFPFNLALFFSAATILSMVFFILLSFNEAWILKIINGVVRFVDYVSGGRWNFVKIKEDAIKALRGFHDSMEILRRAPKTLLISMFLIVLSWFSNLSIAYLVLLALDFPVQWSVILITCSIVAIVPLRGLPEIAMTTIYALLGVLPEIAATATILTRILSFWLKFFVGFVTQQWLEFKGIKTSANN